MKWCDETLFSWLTTHARQNNHISATMCESSRIICHRQRIQWKALLCELCKIDFALRIYTLLYTILIFPSLSTLHNRKFLTTVLQCNELRNHLFLCANWPFVNICRMHAFIEFLFLQNVLDFQIFICKTKCQHLFEWVCELDVWTDPIRIHEMHNKYITNKAH